MLSACRGKPKRSYRVVPENDQKDDRDIKKIAMEILQDKRKARFANVAIRMRLANGASGRIQKEGAVISFAIVIAGRAKTERRPQNQHRRRQRPPLGLD